jgi:apolipoprotein N-acyltransferase
MLGGSLWVWMANLGVFGLLAATTDGLWQRWNSSVRALALLAVTVVIAGPVVAGKWIWDRYEERSEGTLEVVIGQPNFDPYEKFESLTQDQQTAILLDLYEQALAERPHAGPVLLLAPETFASDFLLNNLEGSHTLQQFRAFMDRHAGTEMLFGSSSYEIFDTHASPTILARPYGEGWIVSHNSAMLARPGSPVEVYHKSKLVVGTELTPYPKFFVPLDNWLSKKLGVGTLMGRCVGQDEVSLLHFGPGRTALGCAVCYESVYGEHCADYVRLGAQALTIITNDAWWGNTPGYRQHLSYARLRAIELRRDIARCGNTGISCLIDQRGEILEETGWWTPATLSGEVNLNSAQTAFVRHGDIVGRVCTLVFLLLAALLLVRLFVPDKH